LINIRQAVLLGMRNAISEVILNINDSTKPINKYQLLIDGSDFSSSYQLYNTNNDTYEQVPYETIVSGDNKYLAIACSSILAKFERDNYIKELCIEYPILSEYYSIDTNMGYGTKKHMDGISKYGITNLHRLSYSPCNLYPITLLD
jgi:ribonuclease HII